MKLTHAIRFAFAGLLFLSVASIVNAQGRDLKTVHAADYPSRPIHLVVPFPAGGGADHWGRIVARTLGDVLGQPIIVDNVPGEGGNNGTTAAAKAAPDGYTLLLGSVGPLAVHQFTYNSLPFDPEKDFVPIALLESSPIVLVTHPSVDATSFTQVVALAKAQPGKLTFASNGNGSPEQVAGELFKIKTGTDIQHVPFNGAGPARRGLVAGNVSMMFDPCKGALPAVREGKLRAVAVASRSRLAELPNVPTFAEMGMAGYELRIWTGVFAPKGTDKHIVDKLNAAIAKIIRSAEVNTDIQNEGGEAGATSPREFADFINAERHHWQSLVKESGIPRVDTPI